MTDPNETSLPSRPTATAGQPQTAGRTPQSGTTTRAATHPAGQGTPEARAAAVLAMHQRVVVKPGHPCYCGQWPTERDGSERQGYHEHVAAALSQAGLLAPAAADDGLRERVEALRPILDRIAQNEEKVSFLGSDEAAARFVAAVSWPLEREENRDAWAPRLLTDQDMLNHEGWQARARLQAAIDRCRAALTAADQPSEPPC